MSLSSSTDTDTSSPRKKKQTTQAMSFQNFTAKSRQQNNRGQNNRGQNNRGRTQTNNAPAPRPKPPYIPLLERGAHQVVGSAEWGLYQRQMAITNGMSVQTQLSQTPTVKQSQRNTVGIPNRNKKGFKDKWTKIDMHKQSALVDQIVNYTNANGWSQISGGEHDKKWVNPAYPDNIFNTGRIIEEATGDVIYFPISNMEDDPEGLALHYNISADGASYSIYHNGYTAYGNAKDRKYWNYLRKRKIRLTEQFKKNQEINAEKLHHERLEKYGPDKTAQLEEMDRQNKKNNDKITKALNNSADQPKASNLSPIAKRGVGVSMKVTECDDDKAEIIMFSGPTPDEAYQTTLGTPKARL